eukprot:TRINITY_DN11318_c0_g1_i1.p1 TRINITY_DN11318_c0_g1~~TRINITY_DN11318_c0_g1_i1.p1  ORF type:complete len:125 (-),score=22.01 TRINITY_DN11318_c0_g1_i1:70-444(-)
MKLLTHNMLQCNVKKCENSMARFPLNLNATDFAHTPADFNTNLMISLLNRLDWNALVAAAASVNITIPSEVPENADQNEEFLKSLHTVLIEVSVNEGELVCKNCKRSYPIINGIPNMLLREDEI